MAVSEIYRVFDGETGTSTEVTHKYLVIVDTITDEIPSIFGASNGDILLPVEGNVLTGTNLVAHVVCTRKPENYLYFDYVVTYSAPTFGGQVEVKPDEGGTWNVQVESRGVFYQEAVYVDRDGEPIINSAGQRFPQGLLKDYYDEEIVVSFETDNPDFIDDIGECRGKLNSDEITLTIKGVTRTFSEEQLKLYEATWSYLYTYADDPNTPDFKVTLVFHYRAGSTPEGNSAWTTLVIDEGYYENDDGEIDPILDASGNEVVTPQFLDGDGTKLPLGEVVSLLEFKLIESTSFATLLARFV